MFIIGHILIVTANVLSILLDFYQFVVIAAIIISWLRPRADHEFIITIIRMVRTLTEPVFYQIRKRLPASWFASGLDFTPMIVLIAIYVIRYLSVSILVEFGLRLTLGGSAAVRPSTL